jgi:hypothetical protein
VIAYQRFIDAAHAHGRQVVERGNDRANISCPVLSHGQGNGDTNPSLSVYPRDDGRGIRINCLAGCDYREILTALDLHPRDLYDDEKMRTAYDPNATYDYGNGATKKRFSKPGGKKGFSWTNSNGNETLYLANTIPANAVLVYLNEGERGARGIQAELARLDITGVAAVATGGAQRICDVTPLKDLDVIVIVDRDKAGLKWAKTYRDLLDGVAASVCWVRCPLDLPKSDICEVLDNGLTLDDLEQFDPFEGETTSEAADGPRLWEALALAPAEQPRWLAANRLPRATLTLLIGDEGIGKSLLWVLVVAHVTTGQALPGFGIPAREPGYVILVLTEDDWSTAVLPRLMVAGADLSKIRVICTEKDGSGAPVFPRDLPLIRNADPKPDLVVVDCWLDTVPGSLSVRDSQQAREALHPWKDIATNTDAVIWLLGHSNRITSGSMRDRYAATFALRQKARMTIWAMQDADGALLVGPEKANGAIITSASKFVIEPIKHFDATAEHDGTVPLLKFSELSDMTIREHVEAAAARAGTGKGEHSGDATAWLSEQLAEGPRWSVDIAAAAESAKIARRHFDRAKSNLNVRSTRESGTGPWFMYLPQHENQVPGAQMYTQMYTRCPYPEKRTSGTSGENQMYASTSEDARCTPQSDMGSAKNTLQNGADQSQQTPPEPSANGSGATPDTAPEDPSKLSDDIRCIGCGEPRTPEELAADPFYCATCLPDYPPLKGAAHDQ